MIAQNISTSILNGGNFVQPTSSVVDAAKRLAAAANQALGVSDRVTISFVNLRGLSSSFFNTLISDIANTKGAVVLQRLDYQFDSSVQRDIFTRSRDAVLRSLQKHA